MKTRKIDEKLMKKRINSSKRLPNQDQNDENDETRNTRKHQKTPKLTIFPVFYTKESYLNLKVQQIVSILGN